MNDIRTQVIVALALYKGLSLLVGFAFSYMGYRLFVAGIVGDAGTITGSAGKQKIRIEKAAPGTFFALFGAAICGFTIYTKLTFDVPPDNTPVHQKIEIYETKPNLPEKPPI